MMNYWDLLLFIYYHNPEIKIWGRKRIIEIYGMKIKENEGLDARLFKSLIG